MAKNFPVTIYHNPKCSTSRQVLELIGAAGHEPEVVEYLKVGWSKPQLKKLFADAGISARKALRANAPEADALGLLDDKVSEVKLLDAMVQHPVLVNRPIVVTPKGTRLCRPKESVREVL